MYLDLPCQKTDIVYVIQDKLTIFERFFIPIFFTSIGLMSDINEILSKEVLILGLAISAIAIITKSIFCFIPALFLGFNKLGALKIATGMVPRGEVSLIMANVALSSGFISQKIFWNNNNNGYFANNHCNTHNKLFIQNK